MGLNALYGGLKRERFWGAPASLDLRIGLRGRPGDFRRRHDVAVHGLQARRPAGCWASRSCRRPRLSPMTTPSIPPAGIETITGIYGIRILWSRHGFSRPLPVAFRATKASTYTDTSSSPVRPAHSTASKRQCHGSLSVTPTRKSLSRLTSPAL